MIELGTHCCEVGPWEHQQSSLCKERWIFCSLQAKVRQILPTMVPVMSDPYANLSSMWLHQAQCRDLGSGPLLID